MDSYLREAKAHQLRTLEQLNQYWGIFLEEYYHKKHLCIPNWDVGTELSSLTDIFWNEERLRHYSRMKKADACTIVSALKVLAEHGCMN